MKVDYTLVTPFFIETVNSASVAQLKQLSEDLGISELDKTGIIKWFYTYNGVKGFADKMLTFMAEHPLFDMSRLSQMEHYYCTLKEPVPVPFEGKGYKVKQFLEKGIFRITVKESDDAERTYIVTNNRLELQRVLGEDYYRYYESKTIRVTWALNMIAKELTPDYDIFPDINHEDIPVTQETYDKLKSCGLILSKTGMSSVRTYKELCKYLMLLRVKTIIENPDKSNKNYAVVLARNCQAWYNPSDKEVYSYYIELDTSKIVRVDRLSVASVEVNHSYRDDKLGETTYSHLKDWISTDTEDSKSGSSTNNDNKEASTDRSDKETSTDRNCEERVQKEKPSIIDVGYELLSFLKADFTNAESVEPPSSDLKLKNLLSDGLYQVWNSTGVHYVSSDVSCLNKLVGFAGTRVLNLMMQEKKDIEAWLEVGKILNSKFKGQEDIVRHRYEPASMYVSENIMPSYVAGKLRGMCVGELYYLEVSELIRLSFETGGADEKPTGVNTYEIYLELDSLDTNEYSLNIRFLRLQPLEIKSIKRLY